MPNYLKIISLGCGVQSSCLYLMSSLGVIPRADYAIFADTGSEKNETYKYLQWLIEWAQNNNGIPIEWIGKKSIYKDLLNGRNSTGQSFASIPAFTKNDNGKMGMLRRQCTTEYKIVVINKHIRTLYSINGNSRTPKTEIWIGITTDEIGRMYFAERSWQTMVYPFCNYKATKTITTRTDEYKQFNRTDCMNWLCKNGFSVPPKSACEFCPFQENQRWLKLKQHDQEAWQRCVELDKNVRNSTKMGVRQPIYLHRSLKPLDEVNFSENQLDLFDEGCTSGYCFL